MEEKLSDAVLEALRKHWLAVTLYMLAALGTTAGVVINYAMTSDSRLAKVEGVAQDVADLDSKMEKVDDKIDKGKQEILAQLKIMLVWQQDIIKRIEERQDRQGHRQDRQEERMDRIELRQRTDIAPTEETPTTR